MLKLIFKNLWNRRRSYAWLFIELVAVTCIAWYFVDQAAVSFYNYKSDKGYDTERLVKIEMESYPADSPKYAENEADSAAMSENFERFKHKLAAYDGVERVTVPGDFYINGPATHISAYYTGNPADSLLHSVMVMPFRTGQEFFQTYGIQAAEGSPSAKELDERGYATNGELVITEDYANLFWPGENAVGKKFMNVSGDASSRDTTYKVIAGVVKGVRYRSSLQTNCLVFIPKERPRSVCTEAVFVVRLRAGVDADQWTRDFVREGFKRMITGNYYVKSAKTYESVIKDLEDQYHVTAERNNSFWMTAFFLVNLVLGVVGSFFLQARRRVSDLGVHRSFGATKGDILRMLVGEGLALSTIAFLAGLAFYVQYALYAGLSCGNDNNLFYNPVDNWIVHFGEHFAIISAIVYVLITLCVLAGTYLPARKLSKVAPVDALRDE